MKKYDFLVVGAGLFGASFVHYIKEKKPDAKILVVEKRNHIGGNCYTAEMCGIPVHMYGAHIFRTNNSSLWQEVCQLTDVQSFINCPIAKVNDKIYNLPFNMNTFYQLFGAKTPKEAEAAIKATIPKDIGEPKNLEEWVLSQLGTVIYETLIKEYTEKQWGKKCSELPISIMKRLPIRYTFDNNYYNAKYQGVASSYTDLIQTLLGDAELWLGTYGKECIDLADKVIYTGEIDEFFSYELGELEYRCIRFSHRIYDTDNFQGNAVVNYPTLDLPYTRSIEHKHFYKCIEDIPIDKTIVSYEYPTDEYSSYDSEKAYPIEDERNLRLYKEYAEKAVKEVPNVIFAGRLGAYRYFDMEETMISAKTLAHQMVVYFNVF